VNFASRSKSASRGQRKKDRGVQYETNRRLPAKTRRERADAKRKDIRDRIAFFAEAVESCLGAARKLSEQAEAAVTGIETAEPVTPWTPTGEAVVAGHLGKAKTANLAVGDLETGVAMALERLQCLAKKAATVERMADLESALADAQALCDAAQLSNQEALVKTGYAVEATREVQAMVQEVADLHAQHKMEEANAEADAAVEEVPPTE